MIEFQRACGYQRNALECVGIAQRHGPSTLLDQASCIGRTTRNNPIENPGLVDVDRESSIGSNGVVRITAVRKTGAIGCRREHHVGARRAQGAAAENGITSESTSCQIECATGRNRTTTRLDAHT